jgi:hypothetical protein
MMSYLKLFSELKTWYYWTLDDSNCYPQWFKSIGIECKLMQSGDIIPATNPDTPPTKEVWAAEKCMSALKRFDEQLYAALMGMFAGPDGCKRWDLAKEHGYNGERRHLTGRACLGLEFVRHYAKTHQLDDGTGI